MNKQEEAINKKYRVKIESDFITEGESTTAIRHRLCTIIKRAEFEEKNFAIDIKRVGEDEPAFENDTEGGTDPKIRPVGKITKLPTSKNGEILLGKRTGKSPTLGRKGEQREQLPKIEPKVNASASSIVNLAKLLEGKKC